MKFGRDLATSMVKEWEAQYCDYNKLKDVSFCFGVRLHRSRRFKLELLTQPFRFRCVALTVAQMLKKITMETGVETDHTTFFLTVVRGCFSIELVVWRGEVCPLFSHVYAFC